MKKSKEFYSSFLDKSREEILLKNIIKKRKIKNQYKLLTRQVRDDIINKLFRERQQTREVKSFKKSVASYSRFARI